MVKLRISGDVGEAADFDLADMAAFEPHEHVRVEKAGGDGATREGVYLQSLLRRVQLKPTIRYISLRSPSDGFFVCVPIEGIAERGVILTTNQGQPLGEREGGPFRFYIPGAPACQTAAVDACANVKHLEEIILSEAPLEDTRPASKEEHRRRSPTG
jgi:DMSO/TMAO reductase YedYZ molybdopterin-dependent catalytic subunit